jgi:hypothetical protein
MEWHWHASAINSPLVNVVRNTLENNRGGKLFYLDGPGGTGKNFLLLSILDFAALQHLDSRAVAASGVAALLLKNGQTAHLTFKIPIELELGVECGFEPDSVLATALNKVRLILWDEVVMMHCYGIEAVDLSLRHASGNDQPFGGKTVIFSGDFCQILPVVKYNEYPKAYNATLRSSPLWQMIEKFNLIENMRLKDTANKANMFSNRAFGENLLKLGEGRLQTSDYALIKFDGIDIQCFAKEGDAADALIAFVYTSIGEEDKEDFAAFGNYLKDRCILAPLNCNVRSLNYCILEGFPGEEQVSLSIDSPDPDGWDSLPEEVLNKLSILNFPEHVIRMKIGMPIVIIRNLYINKGVCNGT